MTTGISATSADAWLAAWTSPWWTQLHTADPGAAGATGTITGTVAASRQSTTMAAAASGGGGRQRAMTGTPSWAVWDGTGAPNTVSHISNWSAASAGTFQFSGALTASKSVGTGDTFNLTSLTLTLTPIAA